MVRLERPPTDAIVRSECGEYRSELKSFQSPIWGTFALFPPSPQYPPVPLHPQLRGTFVTSTQRRQTQHRRLPPDISIDPRIVRAWKRCFRMEYAVGAGTRIPC